MWWVQRWSLYTSLTYAAIVYVRLTAPQPPYPIRSAPGQHWNHMHPQAAAAGRAWQNATSPDATDCTYNLTAIVDHRGGMGGTSACAYIVALFSGVFFCNICSCVIVTLFA